MDDSVLLRVADAGTPAYVFDIDALKARATLIRRHLGGRAAICYAMKANPLLVAPLIGFADSFEVCSPGEFRICERAGVPMEQVVLSGVYKAEADIFRAMSTYPVGIFTAESPSQAALLQACAAACGKTVQVLLRLTSGNQFGMDRDTLWDILSRKEDYPALRFIGLQYYSGTQKKRQSQIENELAMLDKLCGELQAQLGFSAERLEYGPGFFVPYFEGEQGVPDEELLDWFAARLDAMAFSGDISLEMGRYLTADCGCYLTRLVDDKQSGEQRYRLADGGIHHLNYYGQSMGMKHPAVRLLPPRDDAPETFALCGALCTVADVMVKQLTLPAPRTGDLLVFEKAGAYSVTEGAYLFLSRDLPKLWFVSGGEPRLMRDTLPSDIINYPKGE